MIPELNGDYLGGAYTPSDGQAEPRRATQAVARAAREYGAQLYTYCAANRIELTAGAVSRVVTDKGTIKAPTVVCAAGAWSSKIGRMLGLNLPQGSGEGIGGVYQPGPTYHQHFAMGRWDHRPPEGRRPDVHSGGVREL